MPIIDWEYYSSHFPSPIPERKFAAVEAQAELEFEKVVPAYLRNELSENRKKDTIFQICNFLYANADLFSGRSVASASNNGYSESYAVQTTAQAKEELRKLIYDCIGTRLAGVF